MKYFNTLLIGLTLLCLLSCKEDEEKGTLTLYFRAFYDGETLPTFVTKPFVGAEQLQFTHLSLLVSDLAIVDGTREENLSDIELVDLSFDNLDAAEDGVSFTFQDLPTGTYDMIRFGVGVPPDINAMKPADFPSSSPLSQTGYYWEAWNSYIFSKTEGRLDTLGNGAFDTGFAFHTGSDDLYRILEGTFPLVIEDGKTTELTIVIDYASLLDGIDIKSDPQNHNPTDLAQIEKIVNNLGTSISLIQ